MVQLAKLFYGKNGVEFIDKSLNYSGGMSHTDNTVNIYESRGK